MCTMRCAFALQPARIGTGNPKDYVCRGDVPSGNPIVIREPTESPTELRCTPKSCDEFHPSVDA
jgi:hypothetical protein